jgi:hypothetical protein
MSAIDDVGTDFWGFDLVIDGTDATLAGLIADAARVRLPTPRRGSERVIDVTTPAPRLVTIPDTAAGLVADYDEYGI